jgi:serine/threonine-protein kinase/endoribonuclease IRE1
MSYALWYLEDQGMEVHGGDWKQRFEKRFLENFLGKQRSYRSDQFLDLLRALRNKKNHWADLSEELQSRVGELPAGYLGYWTSRFPRLLTICWTVVTDLGLESDSRFRSYLTEAGS